jgi:hypothetical protein
MNGTALRYSAGCPAAAPSAASHLLRTALGVCLFAALLWASAAQASASVRAADTRGDERPPVTQLVEHGEYLIWLDGSARAIYRVRKPAPERPSDAQPPQPPQPPPVAGEKQTLWAGAPLANPTGIAVDKSGVIYVTDEHTETIYSLTPGGAIGVIFAGKPLKDPSAIAVSDDGMLYVADAAAKKIFSFDPARKEIVVEYDFGSESAADRLFYTDGLLLALDRESRVLYRFIVNKAEHPAGEVAGSEWGQAENGGHVTAGRGVITNLQKTIEEISDAGADAGVLYLLDARRAQLVLLPLNGGSPASLPVTLLVESPTALTASDDSLFFAEGASARFRRAPALLPLALYFVGDWTAPDIVELYSYLQSKGLLPLKTYDTDRPVTLEEFTLARNIMPTGYVDDFQVLFCRINSSLCTPEQKRLSPQNVDVPPGFALRLNPGTQFLLPDLPISTHLARRNIRLPLDPKVYKPDLFKSFFNQPLGPLARELAPSSLSAEELKALLVKYNPSYKGQDILAEMEGSFSIPVGAGSVRVIVPRDDVFDANSAISRLVAKKNVTGLSPAMPAQAKSVAHAAPGPAVPLFIADDCLPPATRNSAMDLVKYCRPGDLVRRPSVGIIDNVFNENHPAFAEPALGGRSALHIYKAPNSTAESRPVEAERPNPNFFVGDLDHGTHIAGIIGARPQTGETGGLLPQSALYGLTVENLPQMQEDEEWNKIRVFNVSLGERRTAEGAQAEIFSGTELLKEFIVQYPHVLFVVSAGNEGRPVQNQSLAWLGYLDNVIVVGATNVPPVDPNTNSPSPTTLLRLPDGTGSNFDNTRVGLVAPGEKIRSALYNGQYGEASGTSQATAFVSAAAAALMAAEPSWPAWQVKFRLIATADLWTGTDMGNSVFAGELNFRRALTDREKVVIEREAGDRCTGEIEETSLGRSLIIRKNNVNFPIPFDRILRVRRNRKTSTDYTIIYYVENSPDDYPDRVNRYLRREVSVPATQMRANYKFNFIPTVPSAECKAEEINLKELVDFINSVNTSVGP